MELRRCERDLVLTAGTFVIRSRESLIWRHCRRIGTPSVLDMDDLHGIGIGKIIMNHEDNIVSMKIYSEYIFTALCYLSFFDGIYGNFDGNYVNGYEGISCSLAQI